MVQKKMGNMTVKQIEKSVEGLDLDKAWKSFIALRLSLETGLTKS